MGAKQLQYVGAENKNAVYTVHQTGLKSMEQSIANVNLHLRKKNLTPTFFPSKNIQSIDSLR